MVVQHAWEWQKSYKAVRGWEWAPTALLLIPAGIVISLVAAWHICNRDQYRPKGAQPQALSASSFAANVGLQAEISRAETRTRQPINGEEGRTQELVAHGAFPENTPLVC
jgi:hypothetical protein